MATIIWIAMISGIAFTAALILYSAYLILHLGYSLIEVFYDLKGF